VSRLAWRRWLSAAVLTGALGVGAVGAVVACWDHPAQRLAARAQGGRFLEAGDGVRQVRGNDCGPAALAHCLRRIGVPAPYPDPDSTVRLGPRGCGFGQLVREAARWGRCAEHRRLDPPRIDSVAVPAVLYLRRGHFVAYEGADEDGRRIVHDPALGRMSFSREGLGRVWTGDVLEFREEKGR
jgi:ABC-type bacteriocin/lantibiotic exporter with double-glycine peptidase domain